MGWRDYVTRGLHCCLQSFSGRYPFCLSIPSLSPSFHLPLFPLLSPILLPLLPLHPIPLTQSLEEPPGEDCTRFDMVIPTVVKPPSTPLNSTPPPLGDLAAEEEEKEEMELGILKQFTFSSELQVECPPW